MAMKHILGWRLRWWHRDVQRHMSGTSFFFTMGWIWQKPSTEEDKSRHHIHQTRDKACEIHWNHEDRYKIIPPPVNNYSYSHYFILIFHLWTMSPGRLEIYYKKTIPVGGAISDMGAYLLFFTPYLALSPDLFCKQGPSICLLLKFGHDTYLQRCSST